MPSSFRAERRAEGFTLVEVSIAMLILVIVLVLSGTLLVSMRSFAQKQQAFAEPRQTARRAIDYLAYYVRGASDMNFVQQANPAPNALMVWYMNSTGQNTGTEVQACWDNVTNANYALPGTDIFTVAEPTVGSGPISIVNWPSIAAANFDVSNYSQGCPNDTQNLIDFQRVMGCDPSCIGTGKCSSAPFMIVDSTGNWQFYTITNFMTSQCSNITNSPPNVFPQIVISPANGMNPPGGFHTVTCNDNTNPCHIMAGVQFVTFRVAPDATTGIPRLEELNTGGLFNPTVQTTGANDPFTPLLDNVEDLQVAYIYKDGTIWNTSQQVLSNAAPANTYINNVPTQGSAYPYDAQNVVGLRISVVARSARPIPTFLGGPGGKVAAVTPPENSTAVYAAGYYHYRLTATVMIQNRILGN